MGGYLRAFRTAAEVFVRDVYYKPKIYNILLMEDSFRKERKIC